MSLSSQYSTYAESFLINFALTMFNTAFKVLFLSQLSTLASKVSCFSSSTLSVVRVLLFGLFIVTQPTFSLYAMRHDKRDLWVRWSNMSFYTN